MEPNDERLAEIEARIARGSDLALGIIDAIAALAVTLANAGVIRRESFAQELAHALDQQKQRDGGASQQAQCALGVLHNFFAAPVWAGKPN